MLNEDLLGEDIYFKVDRETRKEVRRLNAAGMSISAICRTLLPEVPKGTARRWVRTVIHFMMDEEQVVDVAPVPLPVPGAVPPPEPMTMPTPMPISAPLSDAPLADQVVEVDGDMLIMSDLHIPYHDADLIDEAVDRACSAGIKQWLIVGDMMDGNQWSKRGLALTYQRRWQDDAEIAQAMIHYLVERIGPGVVLMGNHDAWFIRHFRGQAETAWLLSRIFNTDDDVIWSHHEQCLIRSGGRMIRALHGANYSGANPLGVGQRLSAKYESAIVMGHQHHATHGLSWSGRHQIVCMGGMHDPRKLMYLHESPRTNPQQSRSYVILRSGYMAHYIADGPKAVA
jgi:predicted phosphodiesterase